MLLKKISLLFFVVLGFLFYAHPTKAFVNIEVTGFSSSPPEPGLNVECEVKMAIKNTGDEDVYSLDGIADYQYNFESFNIIEAELPNISQGDALGVNETKYFVFRGIFSDIGSKTLSFSVNTDKALTESTYNDNDIREEIKVIYADDISVASVEVMPRKPSVNQNMAIKVAVINNGQKDLINKYGLETIKVESDDFVLIKIREPNITHLDPFKMKEKKYFIIEGRYESSGEKNINLEIDLNNNLKEFKEDNNTYNTKATVVEKSDKDVASYLYDIELGDEKDLLVNKKVEIVFSVENMEDYGFGDGEGFTLVDMNYIFDDFKVDEIVYPDVPSIDNYLEKEESLSYIFKGHFTNTGDKELNFKIDKQNKLLETDEDNNETTETVHVYADQGEADQVFIKDTFVEFISSSSAVIHWEADRDSIGLIRYTEFNQYNYGLYKDLNEIDWPKSTDNNTQHKLEIKNLDPNTKYRYIIEAEKNTKISPSIEYFFTTPVDDSKSISEIKIVQQDNKLFLTWTSDILMPTCLMFSAPGADFKKHSLNNSVSAHELEIELSGAGNYSYYECSNETFKKTFTLQGDVEAEPSSTESADSPGSEDGQTNSGDGDNGATGNEPLHNKIEIKNTKMYSSLGGKIVLKVEENGEAYYINPSKQEMYFLGRPKDAFSVMREQGVGITNDDLYKIPVGTTADGPDTDGDGLPDNLEETLGLDPSKKDSDGDGFDDMNELINGYNPWGSGNQSLDEGFANKQKGKILLQVQKNGEAWYVNPNDGRRYFLGRPADAFALMRTLGLGISNSNFSSL
ncbi:hypothetical protein C0584_04100 [Candidatus Parcubacteria bacterium]|nr:MAG: hypothetical protein C0584_04100 [Candidatus Parcubacteria bacterium]